MPLVWFWRGRTTDLLIASYLMTELTNTWGDAPGCVVSGLQPVTHCYLPLALCSFFPHTSTINTISYLWSFIFYMRKIAYILVLFVFSGSLFAQVEKPRNLSHDDYKVLHWGFTVGLNSMDFGIKRNKLAEKFVYADVNGFQPAGFQVNIVSDLRLSEYWNLRFLPGINLGSRQFVFFDPFDSYKVIPISVSGEQEENWPSHMTIGSSFLDFPLLLKYRSERVNNYRPYLIGGLSYRLDMSARGKYNPEDTDRILIKKGDLYLEVGFGVDSYLQYFKHSTELKLCIGLRNMMITDNPAAGEAAKYANSIAGLRSFLIMLNFHFE
ncbi:MAG: porin family protein [Bacteroidales bacterium]|nr:porin family protein [Bacteroidales bacterium]